MGNRGTKCGSRWRVVPRTNSISKGKSFMECSRMWKVLVCRQRREPAVLDRTSDGEVIEALPLPRRDSKCLMDGIVEVAADARPSQAGLFRLEVEHLAHHASLPEQVPVERGAIPGQAIHVVRDHAQAERPLARDVLPARDIDCERATVAFFEKVKREPHGTRGRALPG